MPLSGGRELRVFAMSHATEFLDVSPVDTTAPGRNSPVAGAPPLSRLVAAASFDDADSDADGAVAAAEVFDAMKGMIASGASLSPDFHVVGAAGIPGLYTAVMHSGITLAPAIGHFVADELLTGRTRKSA